MSRAASSGNYASRTDTCGIAGYPVSMACWFNAVNATAAHPLVSITRSSTVADGLTLMFKGDAAGDYLTAYAYSGLSSAAAESSASVSPGVTYHGVAVFASSTSRTVYLNGVGSTNTTSISFPASMDRTGVGVFVRFGTFAASADIANAAIWAGELTQADVLKLYAGYHPLAVRNSSLFACWNCKRAASPEPDMQSTYDLTVTGTFGTGAMDAPITYTPREGFVIG
jgi:hypothetical protein